MAYADGNSVTLTADYGFNITSPTGISSGGYPVTLAIAFKPTESTATGDSYIEIAGSSGSHWLRLRSDTNFSGPTTTAPVEMSVREGGAEHNQLSSAVITQDTWSIIVAKFTSDTDWKIVIDDNALESYNPSSGITPTAINTIYLANHRAVDYLDGVVAWFAVWFSALADATMENIADGTTAVNDAAPDELIYFESTTAIEGENGSTVNVTGAGSINTEGTDPPAWPPALGGSSALPLIMANYG